MKRFWLLVVALLFLWVDIVVMTDRKYPEYEVDELYGRKTQDFVMGEIVGEYMPIDVVTDLPGLLILLVLTLMGGPAVVPTRIIYDENAKRKVVPEGEKVSLGKRNDSYEILAVFCLVMSICAVVAMRILPFYVNGKWVYASEYLVHLADIFLPLLAVYFVMAEWIRRTEIRTTRMETDISHMLMMVSLFCGFLSRMADVYGFTGIKYTGWFFEGFLMIIALVLLCRSLKENARKILDPTPEPEGEAPDELPIFFG